MKILEANGANIPAIGLGTWQLTDDTCSDIVEEALAVGYRHIDTAAAYGNEAEVGEGLRRSSVPRDEIFLTTKVWATDIGNGDLQASAKASLDRLGTDYVDLLLIHWPNRDVPLNECIPALNDALSKGMARHIGVSNFTSGQLRDAAGLSDAPIACNQVEYHPYLSQTKVKSAAAQIGAAVMAYCPIYRGGALFDEPIIKAAAENHGKTPAQVALRWEIQQEMVGAIPRTTKKHRLKENIDVFDFELSTGEMEAIDSLTSNRHRLVDLDSFAPDWDDA